MRTNEEDARATELMRTYDATVAKLHSLGLDIVKLRAAADESKSEWRTSIAVGASDVPMLTNHCSKQQAEEWLAVTREEYPPPTFRSGVVETRTVGPWRTVTL